MDLYCIGINEQGILKKRRQLLPVYNLQYNMHKEAEGDSAHRNRSKSDNPKEPNHSKQSKSSFKVTGQLVLDAHFSNRTQQTSLQSEPNSLQMLKISVPSSKMSKVTDFLQLPQLKFEEGHPPVSHSYYSQEAIVSTANPINFLNNSIPVGLVREREPSVILESHQKLSESGRYGDNADWNLQRLQMALDYVDLQEVDSPTPTRPTKRKMRRQMEKQREKQKEKDLQKERERVRRERQRSMEMVSGFLSGKATFMWLFILGDSVKDEQMEPVRQIYKTYLENDYEVPICKTYADAMRFLKIQSCFFKVVCDLNSCEPLIAETQHNKNIIALYIYNPEKEKGVSKAFELKRSSRKVRGMFMQLADAAQMAEEEIQNQAKFIRVGHQLQRERNKLRFPGFFILNGIDSTEVTSYRMCLYGSLSLKNPKERAIYLKQFTDMVELRYSNSEAQLKNLAEYQAIDHLNPPDDQKHRKIMSFYVRQTFYYALLNAMLRLSRNSEEFWPCVIPFNETYLAIKHFYKQGKEKRHNFIAYRGARLRRSDVKSLRVGSLIELLGFTSTSLRQEQAQKFMDNDSYLIQIQVNTTASTEQQMDFDHGFIDINRHGLAASAFASQQEVLFNALNVYRVVSLDLQSAVRKIRLSYGALVDLMRSKYQLGATEGAVLQNYRHCVTSFKLIQDDGDALRLAQEHDQCVSYYKAKVENGEGDAKSYGKLAGAQLQLGDIDAAYQNAVRSLRIIQQQTKRSSSSLSPAYRVPLQLNAQVFEESEDAVRYEKSTNLCLQLLNWQQRCRLLSSRAQKKLQAGNYKQAISDIKLAQQMLRKQEESFEQRRGELKRKYFFRSFCCLCTGRQGQVQEERQMQLLKIEQDQILFESRKDTVLQLKMKMDLVMKSISLKIGDIKQYQQCLKRAQQNFKAISHQNNPISCQQLARIQAMQASTIDTKIHFSQFQELMEEAIENLRAEDPLHPDIANYNEILGFKRYEAIQQTLNVPVAAQQVDKNSRFDYQGHKQMYRKCREALQQAAQHLAFHKGTDNRRTLAVNNQLATLDYDFSLLKQAEERVRPAKLEGGSEGAKCHALLAKIALAKGELKRAATHIQKATAILKNSLIKQSVPQYDKLLMRHPLYLQISILRSKVYNRQQKHQLALKELQMLQRLVKLQKPHNVALLANLEQQQAQILVCLGETENFESCVLRSVRLREQAMGKFNIPNAISYSNLFKYLRYTHDFENALKYHQRSTEIFSRFPPDHPNAWVMHLSNGLIFFQRRQAALALGQLQVGLKIAERRYSPSHINFMKIQLQFAKLLKAMGHLDRSLKLLQTLEGIVSRNIRESTAAMQIQNENDDEKISVRRSILMEMKQLYQRSKNEKNIVKTMLGLQRCEVSLRECYEFVSQSEKIDSLKSMN